MLYNNLERLYESIDLKFCDSPAIDIINSKQYSSIRQLVPDWDILIQKGLKVDKEETLRTIRHIFRSIYIYFSLKKDLVLDGLNSNFCTFLKSNIKNLYEIHPDLFIYVLLYHDIGRPFNKEWHTFESAKILRETNLFLKSEILQKYRHILLGVIKHHLLLGTIFTGESSYVGALLLLKDNILENIWDSEKETDLFFQILLLFTVIDILGYDYSKIFNHYLDYYLKIKENLIKGFNNVRSIKKPDEKEEALFLIFQKLDEENLNWRIACALRIFQFVTTKPDLTENFYYRKINQGLEQIDSDWQRFKEKLGNSHCLIQYKYALPLMMILASGSFSRTPIDNEFIVRGSLFQFWVVCTAKVKQYISRHDKLCLWNIIFQLPRNWFLNPDFLRYFPTEKLFSLINKTIPIFDPSLNSYQLKIKYS